MGLNRSMDLRMIMVWVKRATGIGYGEYPPLEQLIDHEKADQMEGASENLRREVDHVEFLLGRGYRYNGTERGD